jgi:hypothetical protein
VTLPLPPLFAALSEVEAHVTAAGWDQPVRLFALAPTAELLAGDPQLAPALGIEPGETPPPGALTPIEQEPFADADLADALAQIAWPDQVAGCVLVQEVVVLPPDAEAAAPEATPEELAVWASGHPERQEVRLAVAVARDGERACSVRLRAEDELLTGDDLAPALAEALLATFEA